ncbi:MAG: hypothetical protein R3E32_20320 [Chitinophagales bacterium]
MKINLLKLMMLFAATLLFSATTVSAQNAVSQKPKAAKVSQEQLTPEQKAAKKTKMLTEKLGLNEEQSTAISAISLKYINEMDALRAEQSEDRTKKMEAVKALKKQEKEEITAQLTEEQAAKLAEMEAKRQERMQSRKGGAQKGVKRAPAKKN